MSAENLYLFFKEAINNAAKHSDAGKVSVTLSLKEHNVEMIIQDNGRGFDPAEGRSEGHHGVDVACAGDLPDFFVLYGLA